VTSAAIRSATSWGRVEQSSSERVDRQKEAILARRRTALADLAAPRPEPATAQVAPEPPRQWYTGPIRDLARNAAARTVRTVWRRPEDRVATSV
jgi:hypothetical protein